MNRKGFGALLRNIRFEAGKSLGEVAGVLGVSIPYLSDVERGNRAPLTADRIHHVARYLSTNPSPLLAAAAADRGAFELAVTKSTSPRALEVGAELMRGWPELAVDDEMLKELAAVLKKSVRKREG